MYILLVQHDSRRVETEHYVSKEELLDMLYNFDYHQCQTLDEFNNQVANTYIIIKGHIAHLQETVVRTLKIE